MSNCAFKLEKHHPVLKMALENVRENYNPESWGGIGPELMTKVARTIANTTELRLVSMNYQVHKVFEYAFSFQNVLKSCY